MSNYPHQNVVPPPPPPQYAYPPNYPQYYGQHPPDLPPPRRGSSLSSSDEVPIPLPQYAYPPNYPQYYGQHPPDLPPPRRGSSLSTSVEVPIPPVPIIILGADGKAIDPSRHMNVDNDRAMRHGFVKKVYGLLAGQLLLTFGIACAIGIPENSRVWLQAHWWLYVVSFLVFLFLVCVMCCFPRIVSKTPANYILLGVISISMGFVIGTCAACVDVYSFLSAILITLVLVVVLTLFAMQSRWDFTGWGPYLAAAAGCLLMFGLMSLIFTTHLVYMVYASLGALLFSLYIIYDTQRILGGKHRRHQYSIDDFAFAALSIYLDFINLFLVLLALLSE